MSDSVSPDDPFENSQTIRIVPDVTGGRLDVVVANQLAHYSRSQVQRWIKEGRITVNDQPSRASYRIEGGEVIMVEVSLEDAPTVEAEPIPLSVLYEDADLVAIDKPAGMVVHPATSHQSGTLVNAALARWPNMRGVGGLQRAGVVHRLDKDTSGVIVLAKTETALAYLQAQFKRREVTKRYLALVEGIPQSSEGIINAPLGRDPRQRKRMGVVSDGREAISRYQLLEAYQEHALLEVFPETGRTHQIRVHLAWLGHPIVGDQVYGYRKQRIRLERHWLHAADLTLRAPSSEELLTFDAPLPATLQDVLDQIR